MADKLEEKDKAEAPEPEATPAEPKKRKPPPKMVIIAAVVVGQIIGAYFLQKALFFHDASAAAPKEKTEAPKEKKHGEKESVEPTVVMLDEIVVNPAHTGGRRYLAVTVGFQTSAPEADKRFEKNKPLIRDGLISLLSSKELDKLADIGYRDSLKAEIRDNVNRQMRDSLVSQVVFSTYVLQ
jgi:flagellar FliL protein